MVDDILDFLTKEVDNRKNLNDAIYEIRKIYGGGVVYIKSNMSYDKEVIKKLLRTHTIKDVAKLSKKSEKTIRRYLLSKK